MPQDKVNILSTRPLDESLFEKAAERNIIIEALSFIETEPVSEEQVISQVRELSATTSTVVFTSMNAAEMVVKQLQGGQPEWKIFCIGSATKDVINAYFPPGAIKGTAGSASLLADEIIKHHPAEVIFFCGDQRRPELPDKLIANQVNLAEIVVYKTIRTPKMINRHYDGILFFSPSAVESFFLLNTLSSHTVLFAIGETTADHLRVRCSNRVITSVTPAKEQLVELAMDYFTTSNHANASVKK